MKKDTVTKLKFKRLQRRLKLSLWQTIGVLEAIWHCTLMNAPDGDIGKLSNEEIAAAIEWDDDSETLILTLVECGWLDLDEAHRLVVHDWSDHAPNYLKGSYERFGKSFAGKNAKHDAKHNAKDDAKDHAKHDAKQPLTRARAAQPSLAQSSLVKHSASAESCEAASPPSQAPPVASPGVADYGDTTEASDLPRSGEPSRSDNADFPNFPTVSGKRSTDRTWELTETLVAELCEAFPAVDVRAEARKAHLWLRTNPARRKTASGMPDFLRRWIEREQNRGGARASTVSPNTPKFIPIPKGAT